jgi:hypothetical protein
LAAGRFAAALDATVMSNRVTAERSQDASAGAWPTLAQQRADALDHLLTNGTGTVDIEMVIHVRGDGCALDDGTPIPDSVVADLAPESFLRALIHDAERRPVNASSRRRHPTTRQKRVVRERDRACIDCGTTHLLEYDHNPPYQQTHHTITDELQLRCTTCHRRRHRHGNLNRGRFRGRR